MTLIHEKGSELHWKDVRELVVGEYVSPAENGARLSRRSDHSLVGAQGVRGRRHWRT